MKPCGSKNDNTWDSEPFKTIQDNPKKKAKKKMKSKGQIPPRHKKRKKK